MSNAIFERKIKEYTEKLVDEKNSLIVLKGIPVESVLKPEDISLINYDTLVSNKLLYFMSIIQSNRKVITYEEFLLLNEFITSQFSKIYVINNNIYMNQYPLCLKCNESIVEGLLLHYDDSENIDENQELGNIGELITIFVGMKKIDNYIFGSYYDENVYNNDKVISLNLFNETDFKIEKETEEISEFFELLEEADYISLVKHVISEMPDTVYIRTINYAGDSHKLINHLSIIADNWKDYTDFYIIQPENVLSSFKHNDEYTNILKKYWGYDTFRNLQVYNMSALEDGRKEVVSISQEEIISNLVNQAENCISGTNDYRDVFVTAPTGAGKSVMFQIPAIHLAEKHNLLTIVISPLIGLMNDQVKNLELRKYHSAKTINSDISPILKQEIIDKVADGDYHILYISPETLLSRSDVEQLIGDRTIGMIVIDEAHIVTTWGKQFRPDYWYLGDHIRKLRKSQMEKKGQSFIVATFTATAIYGGIEDMYKETIYSLHMVNPISYLGYVKRDDVNILISKKEKAARNEYELDKFDYIIELIKRSMITNKKLLIYFPTVALIDRCMEYLISKKMSSNVSKYYGTLSKELKSENYEKFLSGEKKVMLATKAFGMGIDIDDIEIVSHFAPTGNVCDYVQEIGRAARRKELIGDANYQYDSRDFKHINRLHGMSVIQKYQVVEVIKKIVELYTNSIRNGGGNSFTKKRNAMLLDAESFTYIFKSPISDEDNNINKVKTALLIIQKNFENSIGFSPIAVRPIPLFSIGYFSISKAVQTKIDKKYPGCCKEINEENHICQLLLDKIWKKDYSQLSFPKFKYLLYTKDKNDENLEFNDKYPAKPALCVSVNFNDDAVSSVKSIIEAMNEFISPKIISGEHVSISEMSSVISDKCGFNKYKATSVCEVIISSMMIYGRKFNNTVSKVVIEKNTSNDGKPKYKFEPAVNSYFTWLEKRFNLIRKEVVDTKMYLINDGANLIKEISTALGVLEAMDVLSFEMLGGENSQLYIYINQIQSLRNIINNPSRYNNRLLEIVNERHLVSVKMLTYIYENKFSSNEVWDILEDYFLGIIPQKVKRECQKENPDMFRE